MCGRILPGHKLVNQSNETIRLRKEQEGEKGARRMLEDDGFDWEKAPGSLRQLALKAVRRNASAADMRLYLQQAAVLKPAPRTETEKGPEVVEVVIKAESVEAMARALEQLRSLNDPQ